MSKLVWDEVGERYFEIGVKHGVLYPQEDKAYPVGVAWNGLATVTESPDGGEVSDVYADDMKYLQIRSVENFKGTIEAFYYPDEFAPCNGETEVMTGVRIGQQARKPFGFCYTTRIGNDTEFEDYGYKINLVWGATVSPTEETHETINDSPEPDPFSWDFDTIPVPVTGHKPTAHMEIDSTKFTTAGDQEKLEFLEAVLFGRDAAEAQAAVYAATSDTIKQAGKTYYTKDGTTYTEFTGGSFAQGTTYYELVTPAHDAVSAITPHLPMPDDVLYILEHGSERSA